MNPKDSKTYELAIIASRFGLDTVKSLNVISAALNSIATPGTDAAATAAAAAVVMEQNGRTIESLEKLVQFLETFN